MSIQLKPLFPGSINSPLLNSVQHLRHVFLGRQGGISQGPFASLNIGYGLGDDDKAIEHNWAKIADSLKVEPDHLVRVEQVHSNKLIVIDTQNLPTIHRQKADALLTSLPGVALSIRTADCLPVLFADNNGPIIAAAHAGWRGLANGIIEVTVQAMCKQGTILSDIRVAVGPHIAACCYEVGLEVCAALGPESVVERDGKIFADMSTVAQRQLLRAGLMGEQIDMCNPCVSCEAEHFFSHRRDQGITGRQLSAIVRS